MVVFDPAYRKPQEARLSRMSCTLVIGALSAAAWVPVILVGFKLWQMF